MSKQAVASRCTIAHIDNADLMLQLRRLYFYLSKPSSEAIGGSLRTKRSNCWG